MLSVISLVHSICEWKQRSPGWTEYQPDNTTRGPGKVMKERGQVSQLVWLLGASDQWQTRSAIQMLQQIPAEVRNAQLKGTIKHRDIPGQFAISAT